MNTENFIWEPKCYDGFEETVKKEIFEDRIYELFFEVEKATTGGALVAGALTGGRRCVEMFFKSGGRIKDLIANRTI